MSQSIEVLLPVIQSLTDQIDKISQRIDRMGLALEETRSAIVEDRRAAEEMRRAANESHLHVMGLITEMEARLGIILIPKWLILIPKCQSWSRRFAMLRESKTPS